MHLLLDRSPGLFIIAAFGVVYGVIGVEIWMINAASVAAVVATLTLIAALAVYLVSYFHHVLADEDGEIAEVAPAPARVPQPARASAPALRGPVAAR